MEKERKVIKFKSKKLIGISTEINNALGAKEPVLGIATQNKEVYFLFFGKAFKIKPDARKYTLQHSSNYRKAEFFEGGPYEPDARGTTTYYYERKLVIDLTKTEAIYTFEEASNYMSD